MDSDGEPNSVRPSGIVWNRLNAAHITSRTITYIILLDCALLFFKGLPLRILSSEIECDLPCDESAFESEHLHIESLALFEPVYNARAAFRALFDSQITASELKRSLTILGTFILIHSMFILFFFN